MTSEKDDPAPQNPGGSSCPKCQGRGFIYADSLLDGGQYCDCTLLQLKLANMDRIWKSLSKAKISHEIATNPPLLPFVRENLYITASTSLFRTHFKGVCLHRSSVWDARVRTDADLLDSWLGTTKLQGSHIFDVEIAEQTNLKAVDLPSLLGNFPLVVIILGVKRLPNRESANALIEALNYRAHEDLPVWLVDQVDHPVTEISHQFFSDHLTDRLSEWARIDLEGARKAPKPQHSVSILEAVLAEVSEQAVQPVSRATRTQEPREPRESRGEAKGSLDHLLEAPRKKPKKSRL